MIQRFGRLATRVRTAELMLADAATIQGEIGRLVVTLKSTKRFNGCAANDQQDLQIARADGGALTRYEKVAASSAGNFSSRLAINFKRSFAGTAVLCAYLIDGFGDDLSVGYLRVAADTPKSRHR